MTPKSEGGGSRPRTTRFEPGAVIAGRYRLVALLGRGGMGEVYRAEDLTLEQPVALKFLPEHAAADGPALAQFHNELRVARQVSHKNVCRLYDLGEADGRRFLTMEYVDGEDLASLLRRIGRIPQDKAIQLARQLCAGLAAAHAQGVLHRDLKPANVMIDGDGNVRLTDFGIAVSAGDTNATMAGTPQYMAPEQLKGAPASVASDIYALGLILFELFTGKRTHSAKSVAELLAHHDSDTVVTPTTVVKDLDPAVERVIMRCLDRDPLKRPQSALAVAAALPGHDPIAAALAAGETPSPELLAAAAETDAVPLKRAVVLIATFALGIVAFLVASPVVSVVGVVSLPKAPEVIIDRAEQLFLSLGYDEPYESRAYGMTQWSDYITWTRQTHRADWPAIFATPNPAPALVWYRTSPQPFAPTGTEVSWTDPPETVAGMRFALYEAGGRLLTFRVVPPIFDTTGSPAPPDWQPLFDAAGLDRAQFTTVTPERLPSKFADTRAAWNGAYPGRADMPIHIEAAAYRGRPTTFLILGPFDARPLQAGVSASPSGVRWGTVVQSLLLLGFGTVAAALTINNVRLKRADFAAARRLATVIIVMALIAWISGPHTSSFQREFSLLQLNTAWAMLEAFMFWMLYVALEPYARKAFPDGLLGWTRLLSGHVWDARVGRDLLTGLMIGSCFVAFALLSAWTRGAGRTLFASQLNSLAHPMLMIETWRVLVRDALEAGLLPAFIYVIGLMALKRRWPAALLALIVLSLMLNSGAILTAGWLLRAIIVIQSGVLIAVTMYAGVLPLITAIFVSDVLFGTPMTYHFSAWYATPTLLSLLMLAAFTTFAYVAGRGRPAVTRSKL
jgi:serine/threonine-protein kinase